MAKRVSIRCPGCKKIVKRTDADFPFCSDRCRLIDLGKWASGAYVISNPVSDTSDGVEDGSDENE
jgi:uncharacterized protein